MALFGKREIVFRVLGSSERWKQAKKALKTAGAITVPVAGSTAIFIIWRFARKIPSVPDSFCWKQSVLRWKMINIRNFFIKKYS